MNKMQNENPTAWLPFSASVALCFRLLFSNAKAPDGQQQPMLPAIRFLTVAVFSAALAGIYWGIGEYALGYRGLPETRLMGLVNICWAACILEVILSKMRALAVTFLLHHKQTNIFFMETVLVPYSFWMWIVYTITAAVLIFSMNDWAGYIVLTLLQMTMMRTFTGMLTRVLSIERADARRAGVQFFLIMNAGWFVLLPLGGLRYFLHWIS